MNRRENCPEIKAVENKNNNSTIGAGGKEQEMREFCIGWEDKINTS